MPVRHEDDEGEAPRPKPKRKKAKRRDDDGRGAEAEKKKNKMIAYIVAAAVMVPLLGFAVFMAVRQKDNQASEAEAYAAEMDTLTAPPGEGTPPASTPGKFAVIDVETKKLAGLQEFIGDETCRAWKPADATAVVHLKTDRQVVGTFTNGSKAVKLTYHLTVIDKKTWTVLGRATYPGDDPPVVAFGKKDPDTDITGDPPKAEVLTAYIKGILCLK
jgi:hypothetical protein